jgi:cytochrome c551/c552
MQTMNRSSFAPGLRSCLAAVLLPTLALTAQAQAVDVEAAELLARQSHCTKCHAPAKERTGPALKTITEKYRGRDDAVEVLVRHITTGPRIVIDDEQETHKIVQSQDEGQILNLVRYILSH